MKFLIAMIATMLVGLAHAETVTPLQSPPRPYNYSPAFNCAPVSFDTSDVVHGFCQTQTSLSAGGRGGNSVYTWRVYATSWNLDGTVLDNIYCGTLKSNAPWVYAAGFSAADCERPTGNIGPFALIGYYWYTVKAYSTDGAYEAASGNGGPVVVAF